VTRCRKGAIGSLSIAIRLQTRVSGTSMPTGNSTASSLQSYVSTFLSPRKLSLPIYTSQPKLIPFLVWCSPDVSIRQVVVAAKDTEEAASATSTLLSRSSLPTSTATTPAVYASSPSPLPPGWGSTSRDEYEVPLIVACSVAIALIVVTIIGM
jgi:hypothetical protein